MLAKTRGIVLHTVKFGDTSLIVTLYTEQYGRQSYMVSGTRSIRSKNRAVIMQPLYLLDTESYQKQGRELQRLRESRLAIPYVTIPFDIKKSTQALFLAEVLYRILQEEERNAPLYQFIEKALLLFDAMEEGSANFHAWFLVRLTVFLGIFPRTGEITGPVWFDMRSGTFVPREPLHPAVMDPGTSGLLKTLMTLNINDLPGLRITGNQRSMLLVSLLEYLDLHFGQVGHLRSTDVLKEVFDG